MTDQTTPAPAAPAAPAPVAQPGQPDPAAVAQAWKDARAKQPGLRFTKLPPNVAALYADATAADSAAPGDGTGSPQDPGKPADATTVRDPADAARAHAVETFGGDNAPVNDVDAMQARLGLASRLQAADEIPGLHPGVAGEYGKLLENGLKNPPTRAQKLQAAAETTRMLQWRYPDGKDKQVLADAQAELKLLAARIPELPGWLERTGGGNDVGIIVRLAERHAQRAAARIASAAQRR